LTQKQIGFGIAGAGTISHVHATAIQSLENARLVGVYSLSKNKAEAFSLKHNCQVFATLEEMAGSPDIDIVCICTPSGAHLEPAIRCIEAGKHCIIEKPLEITMKRCDLIIEAAEKAGVKTAVIFPSRFYDDAIQLKKAITDQRFGDLVLGDAYVKWSRSAEYYQSSPYRGTWQFDGGGALMNQGIHSVDLLQWYMGPVESVQSVSGNIRHKTIEVEDTIVSTIKFASGALGTMVCSTAVFPGALKRIELMGTKGTAILEESKLIRWQFQEERSEDGSVVVASPNDDTAQGGVSNPADISNVGHTKQIQDFMDAVVENRKPLIDGIEGRKAVEIVLAIYESARSGRMVSLPLSYD